MFPAPPHRPREGDPVAEAAQAAAGELEPSVAGRSSQEARTAGSPEATTRVLAGRVVKPHGIHGGVVVVPFSDRPERFAPGALLHSEGRTLVIASARPHQGRLLVQFSEVSDRTAAERLRGARLEADPLPFDEDPDTYLVSELVGMPVVTEDGRELGVVEALVELPRVAEYDLLEVAGAHGRTWLLPATEEYVAVEQDETGFERLVLLSPPEGLVPDELLLPAMEAPHPGREASPAASSERDPFHG
ncbi:MAG: ribosome maturation factor RimM [Nitriliruptorales bacterium]